MHCFGGKLCHFGETRLKGFTLLRSGPAFESDFFFLSEKSVVDPNRVSMSSKINIHANT